MDGGSLSLIKKYIPPCFGNKWLSIYSTIELFDNISYDCIGASDETFPHVIRYYRVLNNMKYWLKHGEGKGKTFQSIYSNTEYTLPVYYAELPMSNIKVREKSILLIDRILTAKEIDQLRLISKNAKVSYVVPNYIVAGEFYMFLLFNFNQSSSIGDILNAMLDLNFKKYRKEGTGTICGELEPLLLDNKFPYKYLYKRSRFDDIINTWEIRDKDTFMREGIITISIGSEKDQSRLAMQLSSIKPHKVEVLESYYMISNKDFKYETYGSGSNSLYLSILGSENLEGCSYIPKIKLEYGVVRGGQDKGTCALDRAYRHVINFDDVIVIITNMQRLNNKPVTELRFEMIYTEDFLDRFYDFLDKYINTGVPMYLYDLYKKFEVMADVKPKAVSPEFEFNLYQNDYSYTYKSNGFRALLYSDGNRTYSRDYRYSIVDAIPFGIGIGKCLVDSERVGNVYEAFDILMYDGQDVRNLPFYKRYEILKSLKSIPGFLKVKEYYHLISWNKCYELAKVEEGLILINDMAPYAIPPIKVKLDDTVDLYFDKEFYTANGPSSFCRLDLIKHGLLDEKVSELTNPDNDFYTELTKGLIYEVRVRRSIGGGFYLQKDDSIHYIIGKKVIPILVPRLDKFFPNSKRVVTTLATRSSFDILGEGLNSLTHISNLAKREIHEVLISLGCNSLLDIGSRRGRDFNLWNYDRVVAIEPREEEYKVLKELCKHSHVKAVNGDYKSLEKRSFDALTIFFCINLFDAENIASLKKNIAKKLYKVIAIIYIDDFVKMNIDGVYKIEGNNPYEITRYRGDLALTTIEYKVDLDSLLQGYEKRLEIPLGDISRYEGKYPEVTRLYKIIIATCQ